MGLATRRWKAQGLVQQSQQKRLSSHESDF
jgi:hypothetical protein